MATNHQKFTSCHDRCPFPHVTVDLKTFLTGDAAIQWLSGVAS